MLLKFNICNRIVTFWIAFLEDFLRGEQLGWTRSKVRKLS